MTFLTAVRRGAHQGTTSNATTYSPSINFGTTNGLNTAISSGDRVMWVLVVAADGNPTLTETGGAGWTKEAQASNSTTVTGAVFTLETTTAFAANAHPTITISSTSSEQYTCTLYAYRAAVGGSIFLLDEASSNNSGTNSIPPTLANFSGATQDVTVIVTRSGDSTTVATAAPGSYGNHVTQAAGGTAGASSNCADRQLTITHGTGTSPGAFTSASEQWVCWSIGVYQVITPPIYTITNWRFYNDDGSESTATPAAAQNTDVTKGLTDKCTLRMMVQETNGISGDSADDWTLAQRVNGGPSWFQCLPSSPDVTPFNSTNLTDAAATTNRLTGGTGTFVAGKVSEDGVVDNLQLTANNYTELVFPLNMNGGGSTLVGNEYEFKLFCNGVELADPSDTPKITIGTLMPEIDTDPGTYALTGTDVNFTGSRIMPAAPGSYSLTGTAAGLAKGLVMVAAAATYTLTGTDAGFLRSRVMPVVPATYTYTGTAAGLLENRLVVADPGTYSLTGTAVNFIPGRAVIADPGSYTLTGTAANLLWGHSMVAVSGTYSLTGTDVTFLLDSPDISMTADPGTYSLTGTDATLRVVRMPADPGSYSLTGTAANFLKGRTVIADPGVYSFTGTPANFLRTMVATPGAYTYTGTPANLLHGWTMPAVPGSYTLTGTQADLEFGHSMPVVPGSYALTGTPANWFRTYQMAAVAGTYSLNGTAVIFPRDTSMLAAAGSYALTGTSTGFRYWRLSAVPGVYILTGWSVAFSEGTLADMVPQNDALIVFRHNEPEVVRVPKLNAVARQAAIKRRGVVSMAQLATIGPAMGLEVHVWNAPGGYAPAYADGFNWRKVSDDTVLI